jgi:hypothetical protein
VVFCPGSAKDAIIAEVVSFFLAGAAGATVPVIGLVIG